MQLVLYPDQILLKPCKAVKILIDEPNSKERSSLAAEMWKIMEKNGGVGLAAPQVGLNIRMFVWKHYGVNLAIWNPVLTHIEGEMESIEGCLSLPKVLVALKRSIMSDLSGSNLIGLSNREKSEKIKLFGDSAITRIWQHEIDHLDGKLIIDNMSRDDTISNSEALRALLANKTL